MSKLLLHGPSGGGKTHFCVLPVNEQTLVVDTEDRVRDFGVESKHIIDVDLSTKVEPMKLLAEIQTRLQKNKAYTRVVIDSLTNLQVVREFGIDASGRISGYEGWGKLRAEFMEFVMRLGPLSRAGYDIICTAQQGEGPDPLFIPITKDLDPLNYKTPYGNAPMIKVPLFDGAFQERVPYYFDWIIYVTEVPSQEKVIHRYFFERRGMFQAKHPPTATGKVAGWMDDITYVQLQEKLRG